MAKMKNNNRRRLRARQYANRNFCAGLHAQADSPFPSDSLEHRIYWLCMSEAICEHEDTLAMFAVYGSPPPTLRDPASIKVEPALPGYP